MLNHIDASTTLSMHSNSNAMRMHSERSVSEIEESIQIKHYNYTRRNNGKKNIQ